MAVLHDAYGAAPGETLRVEDVMRILHLSRNTVYKLAREGELPSFRVGRQLRFRGEDVRDRLVGGAAVETTALSEGSEPSVGGADPVDGLPSWAHGSLLLGGADVAADLVAGYLAGFGVKTLGTHANAYLSLARMYLGTCHATTVDLWAEADAAYNTPYVRRLLPGVPAIAFRLYKRRVGLAVERGNPRGLASWADLLGEGVRLANREPGSGMRVLLDEKLKYLEANGAQIAGYDRPVASEFAQALLVARGLANVAVTAEKPSRQIKGLDFVALQDEAVDFVIVKTPQTAPLIKAVCSLLRTDAFRSEFDPALYDTALMGEVTYEC